MPAIFREYSFSFEEGETVPDHIEDWPGSASREPDKWHLDGYDRFDSSYYPLAINLDTETIARCLYRARMRHLEETQPSEHSGGQSGIQDGVIFIRPR